MHQIQVFDCRLNNTLTFLILLMAMNSAYSDTIPYSGNLKLLAKGKKIHVTHSHDFRKEEKYSKLYIFDIKNNKGKYFPSPMLSNLWISNNDEFIVGLSDVKYKNNKQLIVWTAHGEIVFEKSIRCNDNELKIKNCQESSTNFIYWYDQENPNISLNKLDNKIIISIFETKNPDCYQDNGKLISVKDSRYIELGCGKKTIPI